MHSESTLHDRRRAWLAAAVRRERPPWDARIWRTADDFIDVAHAQGVAALVDAAFREGAGEWELPTDVDSALAASAREQVATELLRRAELRRIVDTLATAGIPFLLLKGVALGYSVYPAPSLRPRCDVDLLFAGTHAVECSKPALRELGYAASNVPTSTVMAYQLVFRRETPGGHVHWIDAHWALANNALFAGRLDFDELFAQAIPLPMLGANALRPGDVHALVHACIHRVANLPSGEGDRLIWLYDVDLLLRKFAPRDFKQLGDIVNARGLSGTCADAMRNAAATFATPLPEGLLGQLDRSARAERFDIRRAHSRLYQEWHNLRALPMRRRWSWLREKLFPDPAYMRETYASTHRASLAWSYVRRLGNGLRLALRGSAP